MAPNDPREEVDGLREQLRGTGDDRRYVQFEADRDHLLKMSDNIRLVPSEIGEHRHLKLLRHCTRMAALAPPPTVEDFEDNDEAAPSNIESEADVEELIEERGLLGVALEYRAAAEAVVRWINDEYSNEHTNQDYRTALRSFGRYRQKLDEPPDTLKWIPTGTSNDFNPVPSERDILQWEEDVVPMIEAAHNPRDKALFAVQFEGGLRSGELCPGAGPDAPMGRNMTTDDVADAVLYLSSDLSEFVHGMVLEVTGGSNLNPSAADLAERNG